MAFASSEVALPTLQQAHQRDGDAASTNTLFLPGLIPEVWCGSCWRKNVNVPPGGNRCFWCAELLCLRCGTRSARPQPSPVTTLEHTRSNHNFCGDCGQRLNLCCRQAKGRFCSDCGRSRVSPASALVAVTTHVSKDGGVIGRMCASEPGYAQSHVRASLGTFFCKNGFSHGQEKKLSVRR